MTYMHDVRRYIQERLDRGLLSCSSGPHGPAISMWAICDRWGNVTGMVRTCRSCEPIWRSGAAVLVAATSEHGELSTR